MDAFEVRVVRDAYDSVAAAYAELFADDLDRLPVDREVLDAALERFADAAPILDIGCGPGQVGQYLAGRGRRVIGVDLAPRMLAVARRRAPELGLIGGDIRRLPFRSATCAGAVAYYSLQHLPRESLGDALAEIRRVLMPNGILVVAVHLGARELYSDEFLGRPIETVGVALYGRDELEHRLADASFVVEHTWLRGPQPYEHQTDRIYVIARAAPA